MRFRTTELTSLDKIRSLCILNSRCGSSFEHFVVFGGSLRVTLVVAVAVCNWKLLRIFTPITWHNARAQRAANVKPVQHIILLSVLLHFLIPWKEMETWIISKGDDELIKTVSVCLSLQFSTPGHDLFNMSGKSPTSPMLSSVSGVSPGGASGEYLLVPDQLSGGCSSSPSCLSVPGEFLFPYVSILKFNVPENKDVYTIKEYHDPNFLDMQVSNSNFAVISYQFKKFFVSGKKLNAKQLYWTTVILNSYKFNFYLTIHLA